MVFLLFSASFSVLAWQTLECCIDLFGGLLLQHFLIDMRFFVPHFSTSDTDKVDKLRTDFWHIFVAIVLDGASFCTELAKLFSAIQKHDCV